MSREKTNQQESTAVTVVTADENAVPAFLQGKQRTDKTNLDAKDLTIPRIKVAQDQSPEVKAGDVARGSLFLNVTGEELAVFGKPLVFIPIIASKEYILWRDQQDGGGGLLARARPVIEEGRVRYKWDKPNATFTTKIKNVVPVSWSTGAYIDEDGLDQWGTQIEGNADSPPAASVHYNYLVMLPEHGNVMAAFSLSKTQVKRAKDLNAMLEMSNLDIFARRFRVTVEPDRNTNNQEFFNIRFKPAGVVQDEDLYNYAKKQHEHFAEAGFVVVQDQDDDAPKGSDGGKF